MTLIMQKNPSATQSGRTGELGLVGVGSTTKFGTEDASLYNMDYINSSMLVQEHTSSLIPQEDCYGEYWA